MNRIIFGSFSLRDIIVAAVLILIVSIVIQLLRRAFGGGGMRDTRQVVRCQRCNWVGQVSRYAGRCPSCNEPLGDRLAKR